MEIYGYNSNGDLDNEPYIAQSYEKTQKRNCEITKIISNYNACYPKNHIICVILIMEDLDNVNAIVIHQLNFLKICVNIKCILIKLSKNQYIF